MQRINETLRKDFSDTMTRLWTNYGDISDDYLEINDRLQRDFDIALRTIHSLAYRLAELTAPEKSRIEKDYEADGLDGMPESVSKKLALAEAYKDALNETMRKAAQDYAEEHDQVVAF